MKKIYGAYIFVILILCAVFLYEYTRPQPVNWAPDLSSKGSNPFGQKILIENLEDVFDTVEVTSNDLLRTAMEFEEGVPVIYPLEGTERAKAARAAKKKQLTVVDSLVNSLMIHAEGDTAALEYEVEDTDADHSYQRSDEQALSESENPESEERLVVSPKAKHSSYVLTNVEFSVDQTDFFSLFTYVAEGNTVLIATEKFSQELALNFQIQQQVGYLPNASRFNIDSLKLLKQEFKVSKYYRDLFSKDKYSVSKEISMSYFVMDADCPADTVIVNETGQPVVIAYACGKGKIYLCSTPLLFTNFELLHGNKDFLNAMMVLLPSNKVYWDDYYKRHKRKFSSSYGAYERGDSYRRETYYDRSSRRLDNGDPSKRGSGDYLDSENEAENKDQSILSFLFSNPSLTWAWYTLLITIGLYMLSSARRRQKLIPVIHKLQNTTVEFVQMIARLYYLKKDHRDIALKKINYFQEYLRSKYYHKDLSVNDTNIETLAKRSNKKPEQIKRLFELIDEVQSQGSISSVKLHLLSQRINEFKSST